MKLHKYNKLFFIIITVIFFPFSCFSEEYSIDEIIDNLNRLCLVSTQYEIQASGGVNIKLFKKKGGDIKGSFIETDINGFLKNIEGELAQKELNELRKCIEPFRAKIMSKLLGEDISAIVSDSVIMDEVDGILKEDDVEVQLELIETLRKLYKDNSDLIIIEATITSRKNAIKAKSSYYDSNRHVGHIGDVVLIHPDSDSEKQRKSEQAENYLEKGDSLLIDHKFESALLKYEVAKKIYLEIGTFTSK